MESNVKVKDVARFLKDKLKFNIFNDPHQLEYVSELIKPTRETQAIFVDAEAGTGKTSLAVSVGYYLMSCGLVDQIIYVRSAVSVRDQGFLPGDLAEKEAPYMQPGLDALSKLDPKNPKLIESLLASNQLVIASTSFLRGVDWDGNKFLIVDEAQNLNLKELQTVLTRPHDDTKVVVVGSSIQCDDERATKYGENKLLPFQLYAEHFTKYTNLHVVNLPLVTNYRGKFSQLADKIMDTVDFVNTPPADRGDAPHFKLGLSDEEEADAWEKVGPLVHSRSKKE